jgi:hypothetical protein
MTKSKPPGAIVFLSTAIASPVFAQEPGPTCYQGQGYYDQGYRGDGFAPFDAAAGVVSGAVNTAGAIVSAPFRALDGNGSYATMPGGAIGDVYGI